jgi:hypothetical protein
LEIDALIKTYVIARQAHLEDSTSLVLLFQSFEESLKGDSEYTQASHDRLMKFFLCSFETRFDSWKETEMVQCAIISAFSMFVSQLNEPLVILALKRFADVFETLNGVDQPDYVVNRLLYVRTLNVLVKNCKGMLVKYFGQWLRKVMEYLEGTNDGDEVERILTADCMELIRNVAAFDDSNVFDSEVCMQCLTVVLRHAQVVIESREEFVTKVICHVAPTFASLLDANKEEGLWRNADRKLIELMRNSNAVVKIGALKICDEAFRVVGNELTMILPDLVPSLAELTEESKGAVDVVARETISNIQSSIDEEIEPYFK